MAINHDLVESFGPKVRLKTEMSLAAPWLCFRRMAEVDGPSSLVILFGCDIGHEHSFFEPLARTSRMSWDYGVRFKLQLLLLSTLGRLPTAPYG